MAQKDSDFRRNTSGTPAGGQVKRPTATLDLEAKVIETRDIPNNDTSANAAPSAAAAAAAGATNATPGSEASGKADAPKAADAAKSKDGLKDKDATTSNAKKPAGPSSPMPPPKGEPARRGGGGFISHLLASVAGAVLAIVGLNYGTSQLGLDPHLVDPSRAALADRIGSLEQAAKSAPANADTGVADLHARLKALEGRLSGFAEVKSISEIKAAEVQLAARLAESEKRLSIASAATPSAEVADLGVRVRGLETTLKTLADSANTGGGPIAQLTQLTGKINDFEARLDGRLQGVRKSVSEEMQKQLAAIDARMAAQRSSDASSAEALETVKVGTKRLDVEIETVKTEAVRLEQKIETLKAKNDQFAPGFDGIRSEIARLDGSIGAVKAEIAGQMSSLVKSDQVTKALDPLNAKLLKVEANLSEVMQGDQSRKESTNRVLLTLELGNLKRAIERGSGYVKELDAVKKLAPADLKLDVLAANAEKGLPNQEELTSAFKQVARDVIDADAQEQSSNQGILDQIVSGAQSIVRVRRVGQVEGDTAEAVVARMEEALMDGRLADTAKEAGGLKGLAKAAADPWLSKLAGRVEVDHAVAAVEDSVKQLMGPSATN